MTVRAPRRKHALLACFMLLTACSSDSQVSGNVRGLWRNRLTSRDMNAPEPSNGKVRGRIGSTLRRTRTTSALRARTAKAGFLWRAALEAVGLEAFLNERDPSASRAAARGHQ